jgi:molybdopterin-containing oxidoreductase family membrane subunit
MLVLPTYVLHDVDFRKSVLIGEAIAVGALVMCLAFVTVDLGGPHRFWHLIPGLGRLNFPTSMLVWDIIVLNGYLALNALIPFYLLLSRYRRREPKKSAYLPFVILSVFWAVSIHLVTAFLYASQPGRPFWHTALLGPRFLASAFAAGPALIIIALSFIRSHTDYKIKDQTLRKLALIVTGAAVINLIMLGSELFVIFYHPTSHTASAVYLFFGLHGHDALVPWIWPAIIANVLVTGMLTVDRFRNNLKTLLPLCGVLFVAIWVEKGMGLIVPGFTPNALGEVVEYSPSWVEISLTLGIWALGLGLVSALVKSGVAVELGRLSLPRPEAVVERSGTRLRGETTGDTEPKKESASQQETA